QEIINEIVKELSNFDYLNFDIPRNSIDWNYDISYIKYQSHLISKYELLYDKEINFLFSFTNKDDYIKGIFSNLSFKYDEIQNNKRIDNASDFKYFKKNKIYSFLKKYDATFIFNKNKTGFNFSPKEKSVYKFLKTDEIAILYLDYLLNEKKIKLNPNSYIVKSVKTSTLINQFAQRNNIRVLEYTSEWNLKQIINENGQKNLIFAFNDENEFIPYDSFTNWFDSIQFTLDLIDMIWVYKKNNLTLIDKLLNIKRNYDWTIFTKKSIEIDYESAIEFLRKIKNAKFFGDEKIVNLIEYEDFQSTKDHLMKITFLNGNYQIISYSHLKQKIEILTNVVQKNKEDNSEINAIIKEKYLNESVLDFMNKTGNKKNMTKQIFKYFFFILIFIGIFVFLFFSVYNIDKSGRIGNTNISKTLSTLWRVVNMDIYTRAGFAFICLYFLIVVFFNSLIIKKAIHVQNEKAKFLDIFIANVLGIVAQNITPKSIGGDIATYWYLKKRGVKNSTLLSAIIVNTFFWQIVNILLVLIFVPIGIYFYWDFFKKMNNETVWFLTFLVLGLVLDTAVATIFLVVSMNLYLQRKFLSFVIWLIEWLPITGSFDTRLIYTKYKYEFYQIKHGLNLIFKKKILFPELLFYKFVVWLIWPAAIFAKSAHLLQNNLIGGWYFNMTSSSILIKSANSISITPGGTGTADYFAKMIYKEILLSSPHFGLDNPSKSAAALTAISTLGLIAIPTLISTLLLIIVFCTDNHLKKKELKYRNQQLLDNNIIFKKRPKSYLQPIIYFIFFILLFGLFTLFVFY
ncbi:lysylphosphatidylglycerol synthase transmembrane domain-containing protein, partial [Mycoplasmopsis pullorum]|uniref:lysylphosphatidylglycerol synthase transmembrane domain-containing protein n=1 Tax=Mycoplasmopsis pullorum TaxID=48003 RepID=UPI001118E1BE